MEYASDIVKWISDLVPILDCCSRDDQQYFQLFDTRIRLCSKDTTIIQTPLQSTALIHNYNIVCTMYMVLNGTSVFRYNCSNGYNIIFHYCMTQFLSSTDCCCCCCRCCGDWPAAAVLLPGDRWAVACCLAYAMASLGTYEILAAAPAPGPYGRRAGNRYTDRSSSSLPELDEHVEQQPCSADESSSSSLPVGGGGGGGIGLLFRLRLRLRLFRPSRRRRLVRPEVGGSVDDIAVPSKRTDLLPPVATVSGVDDDDEARRDCGGAFAAATVEVDGGVATASRRSSTGRRLEDEEDGGNGSAAEAAAAVVSFSNSFRSLSVISSSEMSFSRNFCGSFPLLSSRCSS